MEVDYENLSGTAKSPELYGKKDLVLSPSLTISEVHKAFQETAKKRNCSISLHEGKATDIFGDRITGKSTGFKGVIKRERPLFEIEAISEDGMYTQINFENTNVDNRKKIAQEFLGIAKCFEEYTPKREDQSSI